MKVKHLKKYLNEFNDNLEVYFLEEEPELKAFKITKIGLVEGTECLVLGHLECPKCKGE